MEERGRQDGREGCKGNIRNIGGRVETEGRVKIRIVGTGEVIKRMKGQGSEAKG